MVIQLHPGGVTHTSLLLTGRLFSSDNGFLPLVAPTASPAAEAPHLWFMSTLQPASTSRCGNARSASPRWTDYSRAKGTEAAKFSVFHWRLCICELTVFSSFQHVHSDEVTSEEEEEEEMGEVTTHDTRVEYLQLNGPIPLHPVCYWYAGSRTSTWTKTWTIMTWKRRSQ